jgi:hypothetical protein
MLHYCTPDSPNRPVMPRLARTAGENRYFRDLLNSPLTSPTAKPGEKTLAAIH